MTRNNADALNLYREASTYLVFRFPFIACPLLRLDVSFTNAVDSASTDGRTLTLNPEFWSSCSSGERVFVLGHCALHVAHLHHLRQGTRDAQLWNNAADYIVNAALRDAGFQLVDGTLYDPRYDEWSVEEVYADLEAQQQQRENDPSQKQEGNGNGQGNDGASQSNAANATNTPQSPPDASPGDAADDSAPTPAPAPFGGTVEPLTHVNDDGTRSPLTPAELAEEEAECQLAAYQATVAEAMSGNHNPASAQRVVDAVSPGFDAREELREFCQRHAGREDYDWGRPSLSFLSSANLYLPSLSRANDLRSIVFAIDTSGSIRHEHLELMSGVIEDTLAAYPDISAHVVYCDTAVRATEDFDANSPLPISLRRARGGGGTRFAPVFDYVESCATSLADDAKPEPVALIYLTDLLGSDVNQLREPPYPVLWATIGRTRRAAPFGRRVDIKPQPER